MINSTKGSGALTRINSVGSPTSVMLKEYPKAFLDELPAGHDPRMYARTPEGRWVPKNFLTSHPDVAIQLIYPAEILNYIDGTAKKSNRRVQEFMTVVSRVLRKACPLQRKEADPGFSVDVKDKEQFADAIMAAVAAPLIVAILEDLRVGDDIMGGMFVGDQDHFPYIPEGQKTSSLLQIALSSARRNVQRILSGIQ